MKTSYRFLVFSSLLVGLGIAGARPLAARSDFEAIDGQLRAGKWEAARTAVLGKIDVGRKMLFAPYLANAVGRLAVAEAGLGREEDAIWHWHIAQNLDRAALSEKALATFGKAGELLARNPLRGVDQAPPGWTVLRTVDPAGDVRPERKREGEVPPLSAEVGQLAAPKSLEVQVVVDAAGRLREPVVIAGGVPGMIWETLEGLRSWRYEPARRGDQAVAVFRALTLHPPARSPLTELATLSPKTAKIEALLREKNWLKADKGARKAWADELDDKQPSRERLAAILSLRALAQAGAGETDAAICRWQAAQHLDERLYDADLAAYGAAGELLDRNRWGVARAASRSEGMQVPEVAKKAPFPYPSKMREMLQGTVMLAGIVDASGAVHQPVIVQIFSNIRGAEDAFRPVSTLTDGSGARDVTRLVAISALDALCDWRFRPATLDGKAVAYQGAIPVGFNSISRSGAIGMTGGWSEGGLRQNPGYNPPVAPRAQPMTPTVWW